MCVSWGSVPQLDPVQNQFTFTTELPELQHRKNTPVANTRHFGLGVKTTQRTAEDRRRHAHGRRLIGKR